MHQFIFALIKKILTIAFLFSNSLCAQAKKITFGVNIYDDYEVDKKKLDSNANAIILRKFGTEKKSIDSSYASMTQGNHIVLWVSLKGDTTWLECTNQKITFGFLSDFTDVRVVLAYMPDGGKLLRTPKWTTANNLQVRTSNLLVNADGNVNWNIKTIFSSAQYDNHQDILGEPEVEQNRLLKGYYNIDNIDFEHISFNQKKEINSKLTENIDLSIRNYAPVNGSKMFLQLNAFNVKKSVPEIINRTLSVYINRGYTDEHTIIYTLQDIYKQI